MIPTILDTVHQALRHHTPPILVAIDGRSGAGKSTLATILARSTHATVVPSDDFFAAEITSAQWNSRTPSERARDAIDWRRLRAEALEPLLAGQPATWHPFDFATGQRPDGTYAVSPDLVRREPAPLIILDGAYSSRPELADLTALTILVDLPQEVRLKRLDAREAPDFLASWHARWDVAEDYYFTQVRPPSAFDLVVDGLTIDPD
jgi:uridine kinase